MEQFPGLWMEVVIGLVVEFQGCWVASGDDGQAIALVPDEGHTFFGRLRPGVLKG